MASVPLSTLIRRTLIRRCPVCGQGAILRSHFQMNRTCPVCQVTFWKDPGEALGAMYLDYAVAVGLFLVSWAVLDWSTKLSVFMQVVILGAISGCGVLLCYPLTRSAWTMLVYLAGGIEPSPMRLLDGGAKAPRASIERKLRLVR